MLEKLIVMVEEPSMEAALERLLKRAGYFSTGLRKVEFARTVAAHMAPDRNRSGSFQAFAGAVAVSMGQKNL